jgi:hypothetical protein
MGKKAKGDSTPARPRPESTDPGDARWWSLVLVAKRLMTRLGPEGDVALSVYREGLVCGQQYCMVRPIPTVRQPSPEPWRLMAPDEWAHREMSWSPARAGYWSADSQRPGHGFQMPPEPDFVHVRDTETCRDHSYSARFLAWGPYVGSLLLPTDSVAPIPTDSVGPSPVANPPPKPDTLQERLAGRDAERVVDSVCARDCALAGFGELNALRAGLQALAALWSAKRKASAR